MYQNHVPHDMVHQEEDNITYVIAYPGLDPRSVERTLVRKI